MTLFTADISIWEKSLGWLCAFAMILFVGLIIAEIIKNRKEKPLLLKHKKILIFIWIIFIVLWITLPDTYRPFVFFIGNLIFVIYIFRMHYIQENDKKNNIEITCRRKDL